MWFRFVLSQQHKATCIFDIAKYLFHFEVSKPFKSFLGKVFAVSGVYNRWQPPENLLTTFIYPFVYQISLAVYMLKFSINVHSAASAYSLITGDSKFYKSTQR